MHAAYTERHGSTGNIRYRKLPVPAPGPTDVLVRVEALAVIPVDTFIRSGTYLTPLPFPFIIGRDLVGWAAAGGSGVAHVRAGDRVWTVGRQGAARVRRHGGRATLPPP